MWIVIIILGIGLFLYFNNESHKTKVANEFILSGGFRKSFPILTTYFENDYKMSFVNDTGRSFTYSKNVKDKNGVLGKLFIGVKLDFDKPLLFSKFVNGYRQEFNGLDVSNFDYCNINGIEKCLDISLKQIKKEFVDVEGQKQKNVLNEEMKKNTNEKKTDVLEKVLVEDDSIPLMLLKQKVTNLVKSKQYFISCFGEDLASQRKKEPTKEEIEYYQKLYSQVNSEVEPKVQKVIDRESDYYEKRNLNVGLSKIEIEKFKCLNRFLNDWKTLGGIISDDGQTMTEMLILIDKYETEKENKHNFIMEWKNFESRMSDDKTGAYKIFVNDFYIPDLICRTKVVGNLFFLRGSMNPTHGTNSIKEISQVPKSYNQFFISGYPDVYNWTQENFNSGKIKVLNKLFKLSDEDAQQYFDNPDKIYKFYRKLIDQYVSENNELECKV
jgi:hypothetical protein